MAHFIVLPFIDPVMARLFPSWLFALIHAMFGVALGWYLVWRWSHAPAAETHVIPSHA